MLYSHEPFGIGVEGEMTAFTATNIQDRQADDVESLRRRYYELRDQARIQVDEIGDLEAGLRLYDDATEVAEQLGDEELVDMAFCNRSAVEITLGDYDSSRERLRAILMRNRTFPISFAAAYNLSFSHEFKKEYKKALFYAQIARDRAVGSGDSQLVAKAHNQLGNCLLAESYFDAAASEFREAIGLLPAEQTVLRTAVLGNLGYAMVILGDHREGFRLLFESLRWCRRSGKHGYEAGLHLCLCYAYGEIGRYEPASRHGKRSLALAEAAGDSEGIKYALFMLGEVAKSLGEYDAAWDSFDRLQQEFYPGEPQLPELMLFFDTKQIVNLRA